VPRDLGDANSANKQMIFGSNGFASTASSSKRPPPMPAYSEDQLTKLKGEYERIMPPPKAPVRHPGPPKPSSVRLRGGYFAASALSWYSLAREGMRTDWSC
jgi:hypothetical protein